VTGYVAIGTVRTVNPARREARVKPVAGAERRFDTLDTVYVEQNGVALACRVIDVLRAKAEVRLTLAPGVPRDTVRDMQGAAILLPEDTAQPQDEDELSASDLVGFKALGEDGEEIGTVTAAYETPMNSAIEILNSEQDTAPMVAPVIDQVVADIDLEGETITLRNLDRFAVYAGNEDDD
jgi:16S rRNA processing protein RimM